MEAAVTPILIPPTPKEAVSILAFASSFFVVVPPSGIDTLNTFISAY